mmetsp:Transcript_5710/g.14554  ORF Transcript_5710/g.14554 Transcript_5710/m.14554 type:complete len:95 (-) Transcript_5710:112-396(-)
MYVNRFGRTTELIAEFWKLYPSILVTPSGMTTGDERCSQSPKALAPMLCTVCGITTDLRYGQPLKKDWGNEAAPSGITTVPCASGCKVTVAPPT